MNIWKRLVVLFAVCFCCIGCDQGTKYFAAENLAGSPASSYLSDTVRISYAENRGAFLGMGKNLPENTRFYIFTVLVGLFLAGFLLYILFTRSANNLMVVALSFMFAGGASNFYDRATNDGAVIDFLNVGIGPLRTGIFNVADMAILFGVLVFLIASYKTPPEPVQ